MPSITIRDIPAEAHDQLASRAARSGRSLQEYLRLELIELAHRPDASALLAHVRERKQAAPTAFPADRILGHRDADRA